MKSGSTDDAKPKGPPVGIDSNILIYAMQTDADFMRINDPMERSQAQILSKAALRLLARIRDKKSQVFLSTISLGECLVKVPPSQHNDAIRIIRKMCTLVDYNVRAATIAATMVDLAKAANRDLRLRIDRPVLMADVKIIASLRVARVSKIYMNDEACCKLANEFIPAEMLATEAVDLLEGMEDNTNPDTRFSKTAKKGKQTET